MSVFRAPENFDPLAEAATEHPEIDTQCDRILVCFIHPKSGGSGQQGKSLLKKLRSILSVRQVFDVTAVNRQKVLSYYDRVLPDGSWRVLVAGGDGTVAWIVRTDGKIYHLFCHIQGGRIKLVHP